MAVNLPAQQKRAYVTFSQPKSNMDWFRYVCVNLSRIFLFSASHKNFEFDFFYFTMKVRGFGSFMGKTAGWGVACRFEYHHFPCPITRV